MTKLFKLAGVGVVLSSVMAWSVYAYGDQKTDATDSFATSVALTNTGPGETSPAGPTAAQPAPSENGVDETSPASPAKTGDDLVEETRPGTFVISFQDTELTSALRMLGRQGKKNIVMGKDVTGTVNATLYDVTFYEALDAVLRMNGYVYQEEGNFIYIYTPEELAAITQTQQKVAVRMFKLSYVPAQDASDLIEPALSPEGVVSMTPAAEVGVEHDTESAGGNNMAIKDILIVRDYEANLDAVGEILAEVDARPDQVLIEATILSARIDEDNALGVNFSTLANIDFEMLGSSSTGVGNMTPGGLTGDAVNVRAGEISTGFVPIDGGLKIGFLSNSVSFFITALENVTDTTVLANPKLLVLNKQRGQVVVGARDGYRTTVVNDGVSTEEVHFLETGTRLRVRPFIGADGYIRLEIHPEDSDGSIDEVSQLPNETTTEVTSNIMVRDGQTIVIGGLFRDEVSEARSQVPLLGNIKGAGVLFRNTTDTIERREVIIIITPHIVRYESDQEVTDELVEDIERFRIGQRYGLRWWGRSRLAASYTRTANEAFLRGDSKNALWNVDAALSLDPRLLEAIDLKEQITNEAYTNNAVRVSAVRYIVEDMIKADMATSEDGRSTTPEVDATDNVQIVPIAEDVVPATAAPAEKEGNVPDSPEVLVPEAISPEPTDSSGGTSSEPISSEPVNSAGPRPDFSTDESAFNLDDVGEELAQSTRHATLN